MNTVQLLPGRLCIVGGLGPVSLLSYEVLYIKRLTLHCKLFSLLKLTQIHKQLNSLWRRHDKVVKHIVVLTLFTLSTINKH